MTARSFVIPFAAAILGLAAAAFAGVLAHNAHAWALWIPVATLTLAAGLSFARSLGAQLLCRGVLWTNLLLGAFVVLFTAPEFNYARVDFITGIGLAFASGIALLVLGQHGLDTESQRFRPVAFRGILSTALVLALADTQSLLVWGSLAIEHHHAEGVTLYACAVAMAVGIYGLFSLKTWGLLLNIVSNVFIAAIVISGVLNFPRELSFFLAGTALMQLLLPLPMFVRMWRRQGAPTPSRWAARSSAVAVCAVLTFCAFWTFLHVG